MVEWRFKDSGFAVRREDDPDKKRFVRE